MINQKLSIFLKNQKRIISQPRTLVIAEMAWSHDGSITNAKKIIQGARDAQADAISLHITSLPDLIVKNYGCVIGQTVSAMEEDNKSIYNYLDKINLKPKDWGKLFAYAKQLGLLICAMPSDLKSLQLCIKLNPDIYILAAACFVEENFIIEIAKQKKPVILRIGGALLGEIEKVIHLLKRYGTNKIILLHGIQLYPTRVEDHHLSLIPSLINMFGLPVGLADHIDADSELALVIPCLSITLGATVIEKHITNDRSKKGEDFESALNPDEFKKFVNYIRETEKALGVPFFRDLSHGELKYRNVSRKKTVALKNINQNEKITLKNITFKRSDYGICPDEIKYAIGRTVKKNLVKDEAITLDKLN